MWIAIAVVVITIAALLIYGALQPPAFSVVRETDFNAPSSAVFTQLNNFHNWANWSPWERLDPALHRNYNGPETGVGAKYSWAGNKKVGEGNMEITHSDPNRRVQVDLNFLKPFQASNIAEFTITPASAGSHLRWEMRGNRPFMMRVMGFAFNMDKMIGGDFEKGLANMKAVVKK